MPSRRVHEWMDLREAYLDCYCQLRTHLFLVTPWVRQWTLMNKVAAALRLQSNPPLYSLGSECPEFLAHVQPPKRFQS
jgi:hypothetical protein